MRILNIIAQYPGKTGSGTYLQSLIRESKRKGHIQGLVAALPLGEEYRNNYIDEFYPVYFGNEKLPFPIVGMSDVMPYESTKYSDLDGEMLKLWISSFKITLLEAIEDFKPDVIISHHLWILTSMLVELSKGITTIGVCHGTDIRQLVNNPQFKSLINNIKNLDLVISLSRAQKEEIHIHYNTPLEKIKVVGGGFNQDIFYKGKEEKSDNTIRLIYVGKLSYQKGIVSLIEVFKRIKEKYPVVLTLVGSGFGEEESHIRRLGKDEGIYFKGEVSQEALGNIYRESDIFVLPSFYEGLSLVTVEALASGLLAVVSHIQGLKDFLGQAINQSGVIEYIDLAKMRYNTLPQGKDLDMFEKDLEDKLIKQIQRHESGYSLAKEIQEEIETKSWSNIYAQIENEIIGVKSI